MSSDILVTGIAGGYIPESENLELDMEAYQRLVDLSKSDAPLALEGVGITPWVASRIGTYATDLMSKAAGTIALRAADLSVLAARKSGSQRVLLAQLAHSWQRTFQVRQSQGGG
jgi:hypothetical protein